MIPEIITMKRDDGSGFRVSWMDSESSFLHLHPEFEIVLNITGNGTRVAGTSVELFDRYDLVIFGPELMHFWNFYRNSASESASHAIMVHFRRDSLGDDLLSQFEFTALNQLFEDASRGIAFPSETGRAAEEPMRRLLVERGMRKMVSLFTLLEILSAAPARKILSDANPEGMSTLADSRLTEVCAYVRENFYRPLTVKEMAGVANMSPHSFSRYFSRSTGSGFVDYVNQVRTNKACYLLRETNNQINDIAFQCGFATVSNFNKQFRKHAGMSARDYRAQYRN